MHQRRYVYRATSYFVFLVIYRQLKKLQEDNLAMAEELERRAASADAGAQLVADQHRFLQEKKRVCCVINPSRGLLVF